MGLMPAWSYSSLTNFETCPKKFYHTKVSKEVPDPPGEAAKWGTTVHKYLEDHVRDGTPLPDSIGYLQPMMRIILNKSGDKRAEQQLAVTSGYSASEWWGKDTWCRGIIDLAIINGSKAAALDYKTGKRKPDSDQLKLFAGLLFAHFPEIDTVRTGFLWLKDSKVDTDIFTREQVGEIWGSFLPRVRRMEIAYQTDTWPAKPSGLCRSWCPVGRSRCEFCGKN